MDGSVEVMSDLGASLIVLELGRAEEDACRMVIDGACSGSGASRVAVRRWPAAFPFAVDCWAAFASFWSGDARGLCVEWRFVFRQ